MPGYSGFTLINTFAHFRGRGHNVMATVTSATPGKTYQIEYHVTWATNDPTFDDESAKIEVGSTPAFTEPGTPVPFTRLAMDPETVPFDTWIRLYVRVQVLGPGSYNPGDVIATFSREQVLLEGYSCLTSCEGSCQGLCQLSCTELCESFEQASPDTPTACSYGCEGLSCQATCELACQSALEYYCHTSAETECSNACESSCQFSGTVDCESDCEAACEAGEELSAPGEIDDGPVYGGALFQFRYTNTGTPIVGGSVFYMGQHSGTKQFHYKIVAPGASNSTIAGTPWTAFPFTISTNTANGYHYDGFQASNGHVWITFGSRNTAGTQNVSYITKSTNGGTTWEAPAIATTSPGGAPDIQNSDHGTIFEGPAGEIVFGFARVALFGPPVAEWTDPGQLTVKRATIGATAAALAGAAREVLFYLPLLYRGAPNGFFGIGGLRMRYANGKYYCFYAQGRTDSFKQGGVAVVFAETIETLYEAAPFVIMETGFLVLTFLDVEFDGPNIYLVCEGRRTTATGGSSAIGIDAIFVMSRDGGLIWQDEVLLCQGGTNNTGAGGAARAKLPMVVKTDIPRLLVTHVSSNEAFTASFDIWMQRSLEGEVPTTCWTSCETGTEATQTFPVARAAVSNVGGVLGRVAIQLTRNAAGVPVVNGEVYYAGIRQLGVVGGSFYRKRVPFNATVNGTLTLPWTRVITQGAGFMGAGLPKVFQMTNGNLWAVQGLVTVPAMTRRVYISKSTDLGTTWTAWSLVSAIHDATRAALFQDGVGPAVAYMDQTGFVRYKRFALGATPPTIAGLGFTDLIMDPDKKETIPAEFPVSLSPPGPTPAYRWGGFDLIYISSIPLYILAYGVGLPSDDGQIFCLRSATLDGLRFAQPVLIAPRGSMHEHLLDGAPATRVRAQTSEVKLSVMSGGRIVCGYDSENVHTDAIQRNQAIFRVSYDFGITWQDPEIPFTGTWTVSGIYSTLIETDRPQGLLSSDGLPTSGGSPTTALMYLNQSSAAPSVCAGACEVGVQPGGCAATCEVSPQV